MSQGEYNYFYLPHKLRKVSKRTPFFHLIGNTVINFQEGNTRIEKKNIHHKKYQVKNKLENNTPVRYKDASNPER